jgi:hypothetical protein
MIIACHRAHRHKPLGSGASHSTPVPVIAFSITAGAPKCFADIADSGNTLNPFFCDDCGSPIHGQRSEVPQMVVITVGIIDGINDLKLVMNISAKDARPWIVTDPATGCHAANRRAVRSVSR